MTSGRKAFETKLNVLIGRLLSRELGLRATSESISSGRRPDVIVFVNGVKVIIEGSYSKQDAESDVIRNLEKGLADLGIALHYKEDFPSNITDSELEDRLRMSTFNLRLIIPEDISETLIAYFKDRDQKVVAECVTDWIEVETIAGLLPILNEAIQFILREEDVEQAMSKIEQSINDFVLNTKDIDSTKQVAKNLYDIFYKLYGLSVGDYKEIDELIYAKGALALLLAEAFYQSICAHVGLSDLISFFTKSYGSRLGIRKAFEKILSVDYRRVYDTALQVIDALPDGLSLSLEKLTELAAEISSKRTLLRRDFAGKIYHKIVGDWSIRKGFATYFTTVPAAYLLAYLAIFTRTGVFSDFRRVKIADFTCGSGTLLTAAYNALRDLYIQSKFTLGEEINLENFHKEMLEEDIWAFDALTYAVQIASMNLAFQNPTIGVRRMNTFSVPLGVKNGGVVLGSLEFMKGRTIPKIYAYFAEQSTYPFIEGAERVSITEAEEVPTEIPDFDFIIMNPPFTRATGRGGREKGGLFGFIVDEAVRKKVLDEYNKLRDTAQEQLEDIAQSYYSRYWFSKLGIGKEPFSIGQAGEGLLFLYLASKYIKNGGKIAFVLPKSLLTGISWFTARCWLLNKFHLEHVVVSYDAEKGYNFSESTSLSETLIVARRREEPDENEETTITILLNKPSTSLEGRALAFKVLDANTLGINYLEVNGARAYTYKVPRRKLIERLYNWGSLLAFPDPELTEVCDEILSGNLFGTNIPMARLGEIATIGIDAHQFHDAFEKIGGRPPHSYPAVYGGGEERRLYMLTEPNARILAKTVKTKKGKMEKPGDRLFKKFSSNLLIPDRIRVNTAHVIAIYCSEPVLSNIFYALKLKSENVEEKLKALCLWFNTTWGILSILSNRSETEGAWIRLKMTHWRLQPVLDVTRLNEDVTNVLVRAFDKYCRKALKRLPEQFNPKDIDPTRLSIDKEFANALGITVSEEEFKELYKRIYENLHKMD